MITIDESTRAIMMYLMCIRGQKLLMNNAGYVIIANKCLWRSKEIIFYSKGGVR